MSTETRSDAETPFGARTVAILVAVGLVLAAAFALLTAYAPALQSGHDGGAHALSVSGNGFGGIVQLARDTGIQVRTGRDMTAGRNAGLLVLTPAADTPPEALRALLASPRPPDATVLIILPKWAVQPYLTPAGLPVRGWVAQAGMLPPRLVTMVLAKLAPDLAITQAAAKSVQLTGADFAAAIAAPVELQSIGGPGIRTALGTRDGRTVLAWVKAPCVYILADPDLLANNALRDPARAQAALALLRNLGATRDGGLVFDVTLNGFATGNNLFRLAFEPPFLALTLCLLAAAALAGVQAVVRFGVPQPAPRAIAFGKRALADNAAQLIRAARREPAMVRRYAVLVRDAVATAVGAPHGLDDAALANWLDTRSGNTAYSDLAARADDVVGRDAALAVAAALHQWQKDMTDDRY